MSAVAEVQLPSVHQRPRYCASKATPAARRGCLAPAMVHAATAVSVQETSADLVTTGTPTQVKEGSPFESGSWPSS